MVPRKIGLLRENQNACFKFFFFSGNGFYCSDVDECRINNGGCSLSPFVQCINTQVKGQIRKERLIDGDNRERFYRDYSSKYALIKP